jgi:hypothetical protein
MRRATASNFPLLFRECDLCTNCLHNIKHPLLRSKVPKDHSIDDVPYQEEKDEERLLLPFQLSYDCFSADILMAHQKIVEDSWSPNEAECFLSVICMDTKTNTEIVRLAQSYQSLREVQLCVGELSATFQLVLEHSQQNPEEFHSLPIPISWKCGNQLNQHVAVAIHLLFLGITNSTLQLTFKGFKLQGKGSNFLEFAAKLIGGEGPLKKVQLCWLNLSLLTGKKLSGWVALHFIAFLRLLKWVFSIADSVSPDNAYEEPNSPPRNRWLVKELTGWLKYRGLETTALKCDWLERVPKYYQDPNGQRGGTVEVVKKTMASLQEIIRWIMKRDIDYELHYRKMERRIKAFLTCFTNKLEGAVGEANDKSKSKPGWLSAYNFVTLLNLPDQVLIFCSLRWHWEGTVAGKGFLQFIKQYIRQSLQQGWQKIY